MTPLRLQRLVELAAKRRSDLADWRELDPFTCLWCNGTDDMETREIKIHGRIILSRPHWYDLHFTGFTGYGTVICRKCLGALCLSL